MSESAQKIEDFVSQARQEFLAQGRVEMLSVAPGFLSTLDVAGAAPDGDGFLKVGGVRVREHDSVPHGDWYARIAPHDFA